MYDVRRQITVYLQPDQEFKIPHDGRLTAKVLIRHNDDDFVTAMAYRTFKNGAKTHARHRETVYLDDLPLGLARALGYEGWRP